jgi:hypothetical protein
MDYKELLSRKRFIRVLPHGYGHWKVYSTYRGKEVWGITTDSRLIDRYNELKENRERGIVSVEEELHKIATQK